MPEFTSENSSAIRPYQAGYAEVGVERVVCAVRYGNAIEYCTALDALAELT